MIILPQDNTGQEWNVLDKNRNVLDKNRNVLDENEKRDKILQSWKTDMNREELWEVLCAFEGCPFYTAKKLVFTYSIKGKEMFVDRKHKSITKSTVLVAFDRALELGAAATGPKKLGCFGASYLYPIFIELGVIQLDKK